MAQVQISVWLRRKARVYTSLVFVGLQVFNDDLTDEVCGTRRFGRCGGGRVGVRFVHKLVSCEGQPYILNLGSAFSLLSAALLTLVCRPSIRRLAPPLDNPLFHRSSSQNSRMRELIHLEHDGSRCTEKIAKARIQISMRW